MTKKSLDNVRAMVESLRSKRETAKTLEEEAKDIQTEVLPLLSDYDPQNNGVRFTDPIDGSDKAAFFQQNDASEYWDVESLIEWLKKEGLWQTCSVRVFDQQRFEGLIQSGTIPGAKVRKFKKTGKKPAPFVRFGKPKKESI